MIFEMAVQNERENFSLSKMKISVVWKESNYFQWPCFLVKKYDCLMWLTDKLM